MEVYPDEHPVQYVHHAGSTDCLVESLHLYEIDRSPHIGLTSALYLPPLGPETSFEAFQEVIAHLRAPDGCPWDREQTHQSLRSNLLEETYEALAALDTSDYTALCEELGDLLLQIVLHAQIACEEGDFSMAEVLKHIHQKIVNRHPHVFGATKVGGVDEVLVNWERIKETERRLNGKKNSSLLDGVAAALPALAQSDQYQRRVIRAGFKWPDLQSKLDKIYEELVELQQAKTAEERALELGDVFFTIVNLAIHYEIDAESALREANSRFRKRFGYIEQKAQSQNRRLSELTLEEMLELWGEAKRQDT
jgi:tetrapyrrole methylase family protein/MazG family protein